MNQPPYYVVDEVGVAVAATAAALELDILYMFGTINEANQTLDQRGKVINLAEVSKNFVLLPEPFTLNTIGWGWFGEARINLIIGTTSDPNYKAVKRMADKYKPTLTPIHIELLNQLGKSKAFDNHWPDRMRCESINAYHYDTDKQKNVFSKVIDAVIIRNLELKVNNNKNCSRPMVLAGERPV